MLPLFLLFANIAGDADIATWIRSQGGSVVTDAQGRVTEVSLGYTWAADADMELLARLKHVHKLDLSLGQIGDRGLAALREMNSVKDLTLYYAEFVADVALANLKSWTQLERLNLRGTDVTDTSVEYIARFRNLRALDLSFTQVTNNGMDALGNLAALEELSLGGIKVSGAGLSVLRLLPRLRVLNLNGTQKRNSGMWAASVTDFDLESIGSLSTLEDLNLGGTKVTDLGMERVARLQRLHALDLSRTVVGAAGIAKLAQLPALTRLNLWRAKRIADDARIAALRQLRVLDLSETAVTDKTLAPLAALPLEQLFLSGTAVTAAGVEKFQKENPRCRLSWR